MLLEVLEIDLHRRAKGHRVPGRRRRARGGQVPRARAGDAEGCQAAVRVQIVPRSELRREGRVRVKATVRAEGRAEGRAKVRERAADGGRLPLTCAGKCFPNVASTAAYASARLASDVSLPLKRAPQ